MFLRGLWFNGGMIVAASTMLVGKQKPITVFIGGSRTIKSKLKEKCKAQRPADVSGSVSFFGCVDTRKMLQNFTAIVNLGQGLLRV